MDEPQKTYARIEALYTELVGALRCAYLSEVSDEDGNGYPLVDQLSQGHKDKTIASGEREIKYLVDQVAMSKFDEMLRELINDKN